MTSLIKKPSAWVPLALSLAMLAFIIVLLSVYGMPTPDQSADEGTPAHLFQLWLLLEVFLVSSFAIRWLPQAPKQALAILAVQIIALLAACFPVFYFHL